MTAIRRTTSSNAKGTMRIEVAMEKLFPRSAPRESYALSIERKNQHKTRHRKLDVTCLDRYLNRSAADSTLPVMQRNDGVILR